MLYFISDTHFQHDRSFIYQSRGFNSIEEMNNTIINNWNSTVTDEDDIYVLGDFFLGTDLEFVKNTLDILNGRIHLIIGNHDTPTKIEIYKNHPNIIDIQYAYQIKYNKRMFYMSHYPTLTASLEQDCHRALFNLFGHTHSRDKFYNDMPFMYNVACDAHNSTPVSIEEICKDIDNEIDKCISYLV